MRRKMWLGNVLVMILPLMLFMASCGSTKNVVQSQPAPSAEPVAGKAPDKSAGVSEQSLEPKEEKVWAEAAANETAEKVFLKENVLFPVNSSALSDEARRILIGKAGYLGTNPGMNVTVEGHCDERGTDAYNLALGERRAESVKMFLVDLGIDANRLNTVSYGKERPIDTGHDEASWARNRRAQFAIN